MEWYISKARQEERYGKGRKKIRQKILLVR
jgi:hypothetical protein